MKLANLSKEDFEILSLMNSVYNRLSTNVNDSHNCAVRAVTIDFLTRDHYPEDLDMELDGMTVDDLINDLVNVEVSLIESSLARFWKSRCNIE